MPSSHKCNLWTSPMPVTCGYRHIMLSDKYNRCLRLACKLFKARRVNCSVIVAENIAVSEAFDMSYVLQTELQYLLIKQAIPLLSSPTLKLFIIQFAKVSLHLKSAFCSILQWQEGDASGETSPTLTWFFVKSTYTPYQSRSRQKAEWFLPIWPRILQNL